MKNYRLFLFIVLKLLIIKSFSQPFPQWGKLTPGKYTIGYKDTVIFKSDEQFSYFTYKNNKPFFIGIWYPAIDNKNIQYQQFKNYIEFPKQKIYTSLYDSLIKLFNNIYIQYGVGINIKPFGGEIEVDSILKKLYQDVLNTKVNSKRNLTEIKTKFPCIIYHHGAQSSPHDNNVFCEYMASQGFIVVSSSFNLPDEKVSGQLIVSTNNKFNNFSDMDFIVKFIKQTINVDSSKLVAVGHSWGAQTEILYDNYSITKPFKKIISLHTTLENASLETAKENWPEFEYIYNNNCKNCKTSVALFAPFTLSSLVGKDTTGKEIVIRYDTLMPEYAAFKYNKTTPYTFITVKHNVKHDGFISFGNIRFPYCQKYKLSDTQEIIKQQNYYEQIVLLSNKIISDAVNKKFNSDKALKSNYFNIQHN